MAYRGPVARWEIYWADLEPHVGSEQAGERRPVIVISNDGFNAHFDVVTVIPLTKREGKKRSVYSFEIELPDPIGSGNDSIAMPQQIRTISKHRLLERAGALTDPDIQAAVENRILEHLGIEFEPEEL